MKRTAKILLSAMLVLMFVFSFAAATPAAWAGYTETGAVSSDNAVFLWNDESKAYENYTGEVAIDFGKDGDNNPLSSISSIKENGISFIIPDTLYVAKVTLEAQGQLDGTKVLDLSTYAVLDGSTLKIPASAFADNEDNGSNILDILDESDTYVFSVFFHSINPDAPVEVTCTDGVLNGQLFADKTLTPGENGYEVEPLSKELEETAIKSFYKEFAGWKLVFDSGISVNVNSGDTVSPLLSCKLVAQWKDVIVVSVNDFSRPYDDTPLAAADHYSVNYADGLLAEGERVSVSFDNESITYPGSITCTPSAVVMKGEEQVDGYRIYAYPGTLTVEKAKIEIRSDSLTVEYDGLPHTAEEVTITGSTFGTDKLEARATGRITDAGNTTNTISYTFTGNDNNYEITVVQGKLKVTKRSLTVTVDDCTKPYDGTALTASSAKITEGSLLEGHEISYTFSGSQTVPDTSDSSATASVKSGDKDVSGNYDIKVIPGKLTVTPLSGDSRIPLTIAPKAATAEYDGTAHGASEYEIVSGKLPEGVTLTVTYGGERTDAGEGETSIGLVTFIQDEADVTANFNLSTKTGKITISPRPITITAESAKKEYDTKALTQNTAKITEGSLASGHKVSAIEINGSQTEVGTSKNVIKEGSVKISDASGKDVTANYTITLKEGTLEVTGKAITDITITVNASKVYDGTPLTLTADKIKVTPALPSGYTISATFSASERTDAGKDEITLTNIAIKDASGNDVTAKFNTKVEKGSLEVTKRPLTVTTGDRTKVYDGKALTDRTVPTVEGQVNGHNIELKFTGTQTKVGSSDNSVEVLSIKDSATKAEVTGNYEISYKFGKLTVTSATGTNSNSNTVGTGDSNNIWIWVLLMVAAAGAAVAVVIFVRKSKKNGNEQ